MVVPVVDVVLFVGELLLVPLLLTPIKVSFVVAAVVATDIAVGVGEVVFEEDADVLESLECSEVFMLIELLLLLLAGEVDDTKEALGEVDEVGVVVLCWLFVVAVGVVTANNCWCCLLLRLW